MQAAIRSQYGPPGVLTVETVETPAPKDHEILVRVFAATVNRTDCALLGASPFIMRFVAGLFRPKLRITGTDFAGRVEAVGKNVTAFKPGDKVWGFDDIGLSSHAQYLTIPGNKAVLLMPENVSFEAAAASAEGAHYAINFVNKVTIKSGQKVLVNGATGAIGSALVQILKHLGAHVTAVCDTKNLELVRSIGADEVLDYTKADFTQHDATYDFIFDAVGKSTFGRCRPLLNRRGIYISSELGPWSQNLFLALFTPLMSGKKVVFPLPVDIPKSLSFIKDLTEKGRFKPLIDRVYPLENIREAYEYVAGGQKTGNVVLRMVE